MRGRLVEASLDKDLRGNTPAYAGKTHPDRNRPNHSKKHPRVCGEDLKIQKMLLLHTETPPVFSTSYLNKANRHKA